MTYFLAAGLCAIGCAGAWLLRDRPLPGEVRWGFSLPVRRRWYLAFAAFFGIGVLGNIALGLIVHFR